MSLQQFRHALHQTLDRRADATLDLIEALTVAGHVTSPVALSEQDPFRRQFSSVYDVLEHGSLPSDTLPQLLYDHQPTDCQTIAGYEVYAVDATRNERPAAETAPERGYLKSQPDEVASVGYKFSWLVRLVAWRSSWVAPLEVQRIAPDEEDYIILMPKHSAFYATPLDVILTYLRVKTIIIAGITTNSCVMLTVSDAYVRDLKTLLVSECVAGQSEEDQRKAIERMENDFAAKVLRMQDLDFEALRRAS